MTVSTAPDLLHRRLRPPHRIYFINDRVHRTGYTSPTPLCVVPKMPNRSCRTPHPRRLRRSAVGTLARFLDVMLLLLLDITYMLVSCIINFLVASYMPIVYVPSHLVLILFPITHTLYSHVMCMCAWFVLNYNIGCLLFFLHAVVKLLFICMIMCSRSLHVAVICPCYCICAMA
jgi:hypothetical protein